MSIVSEELTDGEKNAVIEAVFRWLDAADDAVAILDNFGEAATAERISSTLNSLEQVIERAINNAEMVEAERVVDEAIRLGLEDSDD